MTTSRNVTLDEIVPGMVFGSIMATVSWLCIAKCDGLIWYAMFSYDEFDTKRHFCINEFEFKEEEKFPPSPYYAHIETT